MDLLTILLSSGGAVVAVISGVVTLLVKTMEHRAGKQLEKISKNTDKIENLDDKVTAINTRLDNTKSVLTTLAKNDIASEVNRYIKKGYMTSAERQHLELMKSLYVDVLKGNGDVGNRIQRCFDLDIREEDNNERLETMGKECPYKSS